MANCTSVTILKRIKRHISASGRKLLIVRKMMFWFMVKGSKGLHWWWSIYYTNRFTFHDHQFVQCKLKRYLNALYALSATSIHSFYTVWKSAFEDLQRVFRWVSRQWALSVQFINVIMFITYTTNKNNYMHDVHGNNRKSTSSIFKASAFALHYFTVLKKGNWRLHQIAPSRIDKGVCICICLEGMK